jgi:hypothetical protein
VTNRSENVALTYAEHVARGGALTPQEWADEPLNPPVGARIKAMGWSPSPYIDDNLTVPPGTLGTVRGHGPGQIWVAWDNGATLNLVTTSAASDKWEYA